MKALLDTNVVLDAETLPVISPQDFLKTLGSQ
jgi:hypothetical protein